MRKPIVASSWKMHINSLDIGMETARKIRNYVGNEEKVEMFILPTFPLISYVAKIFEDSNIGYGGQNMCYEEKGAFTGEVPPLILKELGSSYVEIGHAERRAYFNETNEDVNKKVRLAFKYNMMPVVCIGENENDKIKKISSIKLKDQVLWALDKLNEENMKNVILAYEPVWAIGKQESADSNYVEQVHSFIRNEIQKNYGRNVSENIRIIYGGSVSINNIEKLAIKENIDGFFIGRFGLKPENFRNMVEKVVNLNNL
ncbi:triose-phosphate isomerase [Clostridium tyrobutyricum]|uniref:triose-phosphate isomerase n=1 Tax=Clostridium tyrobutyricum TaxID=1519 RepID=UPI001C38DE50|nr:triose-phosphate isomerase [Clostridium tyrobutyricum]MBV4419328.1 triose-phosphate isomerase [Clostridium tyrobutyricum]